MLPRKLPLPRGALRFCRDANNTIAKCGHAPRSGVGLRGHGKQASLLPPVLGDGHIIPQSGLLSVKMPRQAGARQPEKTYLGIYTKIVQGYHTRGHLKYAKNAPQTSGGPANERKHPNWGWIAVIAHSGGGISQARTHSGGGGWSTPVLEVCRTHPFLR